MIIAENNLLIRAIGEYKSDINVARPPSILEISKIIVKANSDYFGESITRGVNISTPTIKEGKNTITAEEWKEIEKELQTIFGIVNLKCDGYRITIRLERISQFKNALAVYVNGKIDGKWLTGNTEFEEQKFLRKVTRSLFPKNKLNKISKKTQKKLGIDKTYSYYDPTWTSFRSLKKQLIELNKDITWIKGD